MYITLYFWRSITYIHRGTYMRHMWNTYTCREEQAVGTECFRYRNILAMPADLLWDKIRNRYHNIYPGQWFAIKFYYAGMLLLDTQTHGNGNTFYARFCMLISLMKWKIARLWKVIVKHCKTDRKRLEFQFEINISTVYYMYICICYCSIQIETKMLCKVQGQKERYSNMLCINNF